MEDLSAWHVLYAFLGTVLTAAGTYIATKMPAILAALGGLSERWATARIERDERANKIAESAARVGLIEAETKKLEADARKTEADTTGRFGTDAIERIAELEKTCEELRDTVEKLRLQLAERDAALGALTVELARLHDAIATSTDPVFRRLVRAIERFLAALIADGWKPTVGTERQHLEMTSALKEAREAV